MRRVHIRLWRQSVGLLAHHARRYPFLSIVLDDAVPIASDFKRPSNAIITLIANMIINPAQGLAWAGATTTAKRIAMGFEMVSVS